VGGGGLSFMDKSLCLKFHLLVRRGDSHTQGELFSIFENVKMDRI